MDFSETAEVLARNAGPIIRFRVTVDILQEQDVSVVTDVLNKMLSTEEIKKWMGLLKFCLKKENLHSDKPYAFANVMWKLSQLGQRAGLQPFDSATIRHRAWLTDNLEKMPSSTHDILKRVIVAGSLGFAGYVETSCVAKIVNTRLQEIYAYEILNEKSGVVPPTIYDVVAISSALSVSRAFDPKGKAEEIVGSLIEKAQQNKLKETKMTLQNGLFLPRVDKGTADHLAEALVLLEILSPFKILIDTSWFRETIETLEKWRTERGTYVFPKEALPENDSGLWFVGDYMAFDNRRTTPNAIEWESTFRMLRLKQIYRL